MRVRGSSSFLFLSDKLFLLQGNYLSTLFKPGLLLQVSVLLISSDGGICLDPVYSVFWKSSYFRKTLSFQDFVSIIFGLFIFNKGDSSMVEWIGNWVKENCFSTHITSGAKCLWGLSQTPPTFQLSGHQLGVSSPTNNPELLWDTTA